jgi:rSAM/selenodomain-associated transferase 1
VQLCVIAKEPRPGFAKTRLSPPCTPRQAAAIAEASLADTLEAVLCADAHRRLLVLDGAVGRWLPEGFEVVPQADGGLDRRLAAAFAWCFSTMPDEPVVLIGMDTPQVRPEELVDAGERLHAGADAVLGPATDGGYWLIGLRTMVRGAFTGVPMSSAETGGAQRRRLESLGCSVETIGALDDVDRFADAERVAAQHSAGRLAAAVACVVREPVDAFR